ncbi:sensor histidine kinase [Xanthocytophaga agilis]|uniref:Histidine kinase n=1 Tax=Xanthocytophaga agilis TaxID=3048010 RepID=A0AAE3RE21_9BACT|nr:histidine kinase [Xanthocytophaga agilis]MDJ1506108.1 histidine kinase [Xanthocytophaga agilis]
MAINKEYKLLLLASPLIAFYGIAPVYLFAHIKPAYIVVSYLALTLMIMFFWLANSMLFKTSLTQVTKYIISYSGSLVFHLGILLFIPILSENLQTLSFFIYPLISTLAINSIILIILRLQRLKEDKVSVEVELDKVKLENLEAQKKALTQQLQPHFLFNALSTLKSLITLDQDRAVQYTLSLSEFLRYTNQAGNTQIVSLKEEIAFTQEYLHLQVTRFGEALQYSVQIAHPLLQCHVPAFAVQSLVENAIKHNALSVKKPLLIQIFSEDKHVVITNPKQPKHLQVTSGTGLANLSNRYKLMFQTSIEVTDQKDTFTVKVPVVCL